MPGLQYARLTACQALSHLLRHILHACSLLCAHYTILHAGLGGGDAVMGGGDQAAGVCVTAGERVGIWSFGMHCQYLYKQQCHVVVMPAAAEMVMPEGTNAGAKNMQSHALQGLVIVACICGSTAYWLTWYAM